MLPDHGAGRFLGVMLHVWNRAGVGGAKATRSSGWTREVPLDHRHRVEDYFGYAWCNPTLFQNAYHNQTISMNNKGTSA